MEAKVYNQQGKSVGQVTLPETVFNLPWNADLVHQVMQSVLSSRRANTAHTKDRGEVRGGGRKPWQQKGTGRARHGSRRSPIWKGGGATFGPRNERNYDRKVNDKMRRKALYTVLSQKMRDGELVFIDNVSIEGPKTAEAKKIFASIATIDTLKTLAGKKDNALMLALNAKDSSVEKSFRNFGNVSVVESRNLNPVDLLEYRYVAIVNPEQYIARVSA